MSKRHTDNRRYRRLRARLLATLPDSPYALEKHVEDAIVRLLVRVDGEACRAFRRVIVRRPRK